MPAALIVLVMLASRITAVVAQYATDSALYNASVEAAEQNVSTQLEHLPGLEPIYFPQDLELPINNYVEASAESKAQYTQNVIFDPCRTYGYSCCNDTYGTPEFVAYDTNVGSSTYGQELYFNADGSPLDTSASRRPDNELYIDESCTGPATPAISCVQARIAARPSQLMPVCWNYNASVLADRPCRAPADGSRVDLCLEVGITQTAYIVECGGAYATSDHCGTFLEIHRPGDPTVLAETRLRGMYTSGYRMMLISTTYMKQPNRVICTDPVAMGMYEVWWIQRTLYNFIVERRIPFTVVSPQCDWDEVNNRYFPYATLSAAQIASNNTSADAAPNPFETSLFQFSRPRTVGQPNLGIPGKGMGPVMVPPAPGSFPPDAAFADPSQAGPQEDPQTYVYGPAEPLYTVRSGHLEPPDLPADQYDPAAVARRRRA